MRKMSPFNSGLCILIAILLSSLPCQDCLAQCTLGGHVYNKDGFTIGGATVRVISRQDSIVAQVMTDSLGGYIFEQIPSGNFIVKATAVDYKADAKRLILFKGRSMIIDLTLVSDTIQLDEVNVRATGIIANGDTTTYIARYFTTGQEQTLGDVLKTLPGFKVDKENNTVEVNGKPVSRILMEKQDLFQGNSCGSLWRRSCRFSGGYSA